MVSVSLVALGPLNMPVVVIRSMRAFRIARIFRRIGVIRALARAYARARTLTSAQSRPHTRSHARALRNLASAHFARESPISSGVHALGTQGASLRSVFRARV